MTRYKLIREIFDHTPRTYKGINSSGEHIIQLHNRNMAMYATLERLSNAELQSLANDAHVQMHKKQIGITGAI